VAERDVRLEAARSWWPVAAGILLGLVVGLLVSLLESGTSRAEASVLVSSPAGPSAVKPQLPNLRELATSSVVAGNVRSTLRLTESTETVRGHLHATVRPASQVIAISATDDVADHARQLAQEAAVVFSQLVEARFAAGNPELHAAVLDSAHVLGGPDRHFARNLLIGGLAGLLVGSAAMFVLASRAPRTVVAAADDSEVREREQLLDRRVSGVSARERALAAHAGKLAAREEEASAREQDLDVRAAKLDAFDRELAARAEAPPAVSGSEPQTPPAPTPTEGQQHREQQPEPATEPAAPPPAGAWNLEDLQRLVDAETDATPDQAEEWRTYLFFLREHATHDGTLPRSLDGLINDVFADLVDRRPLS
jgi:tetrahydromethanopterin S-methyltransferase subunit G